jgi:hypothetical protein
VQRDSAILALPYTLAYGRGFFRLAGLYDAPMGMKTAKICYHLERAAHFQRLADLPGRPGPGYAGPDISARRARQHQERAAELLADGLREYAQLSDDRAAAYARRWRRRQACGPGRGRRKADGWISLGRGKGFARKNDADQK